MVQVSTRDAAVPQLVRGLTLVDAIALAVGVVIGTGVFLKSAIMTQLLGRPLLVLAAWLAAGLICVAGALTYAELGAMMPEAGGEYVFLRAAYGRGVAFLNGWMWLLLGGSGLAALASGFAIFSSAIVPPGAPWVTAGGRLFDHTFVWRFGLPQVVAVITIIAMATVNSLGVKVAGRTQTVLTTCKVLAVAGIVFAVLLFSRTGSWGHFTGALTPEVPVTTSVFAAGLLAALWPYRGWSYLPMVAGEIRDPERNVPRAIIGGIVLVLVLYLAANAIYFYALPVNEVATASSTLYPGAPALALKATATAMSQGANRFITLVFLVSTIGSMNGVLLQIPRVPFAMARGGDFFPLFGSLGRRSRVPVWGIGVVAGAAIGYALLGSFDQITNVAVLSVLVFNILTAISVFILRRRMPERRRPYRTLGYPLVPLFFIAAASWVVISSARTYPLEAGLTLGILLLGVPAFWWFRGQNNSGQ